MWQKQLYIYSENVLNLTGNNYFDRKYLVTNILFYLFCSKGRVFLVTNFDQTHTPSLIFRYIILVHEKIKTLISQFSQLSNLLP